MLEPRTFTYHYNQPADYHFCQDSVLFPKFVAEQLRHQEVPETYRTLDICAGCGVIGLELAFHEPRLKNVDFLEIQGEFREAFFLNREQAQLSVNNFRFIEADYARLLNDPLFYAAYDLIVANPPYFYPGEGRLSPSRLQNRCRFFLDSDLATLLQATTTALKPQGVAYILVKSGARHGRNALRDAMLSLAGRASVEIVHDIRGTSVLKLAHV